MAVSVQKVLTHSVNPPYRPRSCYPARTLRLRRRSAAVRSWRTSVPHCGAPDCPGLARGITPLCDRTSQPGRRRESHPLRGALSHRGRCYPSAAPTRGVRIKVCFSVPNAAESRLTNTPDHTLEPALVLERALAAPLQR